MHCSYIFQKSALTTNPKPTFLRQVKERNHFPNDEYISPLPQVLAALHSLGCCCRARGGKPILTFRPGSPEEMLLKTQTNSLNCFCKVLPNRPSPLSAPQPTHICCDHNPRWPEDEKYKLKSIEIIPAQKQTWPPSRRMLPSAITAAWPIIRM